MNLNDTPTTLWIYLFSALAPSGNQEQSEQRPPPRSLNCCEAHHRQGGHLVLTRVCCQWGSWKALEIWGIPNLSGVCGKDIFIMQVILPPFYSHSPQVVEHPRSRCIQRILQQMKPVAGGSHQGTPTYNSKRLEKTPKV